MKYIVDDRKILSFIVKKEKSLAGFARKTNISPPTLNKALGGKPIMLSTVHRIATAIGLQPSAIILASIAPKEKKTSPSRDDEFLNQWWISK